MRRRDRVLTRWREPQYGRRPLYCAAQNGHLAVMRVLLNAGADKDAQSRVSQRRGGLLGGRTIFMFLWGLHRDSCLPVC